MGLKFNKLDNNNRYFKFFAKQKIRLTILIKTKRINKNKQY